MENRTERPENQKILEKEIDLIQSCISRMAHNSFLIKGWLAALVTVVLSITSEAAMVRVCWLLLAAALCFWYLDAFYLGLERLYRRKYEWVIQNRLHTAVNAYDLNPYNKDMWLCGAEQGRTDPFHMMFTKSLVPFYGVVAAIPAAALIYTLACPH